ncbi:MAG TPA: glycerate kinase [Candidatus Olsenella excrementavium]|uniref:Glycerate kinase n=1 Tax=Candidatus Olsenella excrementavium TaxID=2838709 RepID=A0A9D1ZD27_9ACTN|nr:glycerate kinase [Candidatus Olsenella excrementavium]
MERAPRFVFASDSLKGTLSSADAARLLGGAAERHFPGCSWVAVPMADGGEGTVDALLAACGGEKIRAVVEDPLSRPVEASYAMLPGGRAVIEMAAASGLTLLAPGEHDPRLTSTYGTGQLVLDALERGARDVTVALGGSATNDGGMGLVRALGARPLDAEGIELAGTGADLGRVARVDPSGLSPLVAGASFHTMCDVDNPLVGPEGASLVFGPQKGASPEIARELDDGMRNWAHVLEETFDRSFNVPGAGAAGGLGAACLAFLGAEPVSGIARVLDLVGFDALLSEADLCVTGEGHADAQTAHGKVVSGVAAACARAGVPCVAVVGGMSAGAAAMPGVAAMLPAAIDAMPLEETLARAEELYALAAERLFSLLELGMSWGNAEAGT